MFNFLIGEVLNGVLVIITSEIMIFTESKECFIECDEALISDQGTPQPELLPHWEDWADRLNYPLDNTELILYWTYCLNYPINI